MSIGCDTGELPANGRTTQPIISGTGECQSRVVNVADFTDEPTVDGNVQAALAKALSCGSSLFFPSGTWTLTQTLSIDPTQGAIEVFGAGPTSILEFSSGGTVTSDAAILVGETANTVGVHIHDLTLENMDAAIGHGIRSSGITSTSTINLKLNNLTIRNFNDFQIRLEKDYNSHIVDNHLTGGAVGIWVGEDFSIATLIENNWVRDWQKVGIQVGTDPAAGPASAKVVIENNIVDQSNYQAPNCSTFDIANYVSNTPTCPVGIQLLPGTLHAELNSNHLEGISNGIGILVQTANNSSIVSNHVHSNGTGPSHYGIYYGGIGAVALLSNNVLTGTYQEASMNDFSTFPQSMTILGQPNPGNPTHVFSGSIKQNAGVTRNVTPVDFESATVLSIDADWDIIEATWSTVSGGRSPVFGIGSGSENAQVGREVTLVFQDCKVRLYGRFDNGNTITPFRLKESSAGMWGAWDPTPYDSITFVKMNGIDSLEQTAIPTLNSTVADQTSVWVEVSRRELGMPCPD